MKGTNQSKTVFWQAELPIPALHQSLKGSKVGLWGGQDADAVLLLVCHIVYDPSVNSSLRAAVRVPRQLLSLYPNLSGASFIPASQN